METLLRDFDQPHAVGTVPARMAEDAYQGCAQYPTESYKNESCAETRFLADAMPLRIDDPPRLLFTWVHL
jgi:hypothetical protein